MSMRLHEMITKQVKSDPQKFDFLNGMLDRVKRVDELHPSKDNDSYYVFNVWVDEDDDSLVTKTIKENVSRDEEWSFEVHSTGSGLIVVFCWI